MQFDDLFPNNVHDDTIGIYKITNRINGHCYIGQSQSVRSRWREHIYASLDSNNAAYNYPLMRAFRKYGLNNFCFELLEETTVAQLSLREAFYMQAYETMNHANYNQTDTIGGHCARPDYLESLIDDLLHSSLSFTELSIKYVISYDSISRINCGRMWHQDNLSYPLRTLATTNRRTFGQAIICIDPKTDTIVATYDSAAAFADLHPELSRHNVAGHINEVCRGKRKTAYGFRWQYIKEDDN